jgi:transcription elongation factor Elf1
MTENKKYKVEITCFNCFENAKLWIPFGVTVDNQLTVAKTVCPNCGCRLDKIGQSPASQKGK